MNQNRYYKLINGWTTDNLKSIEISDDKIYSLTDLIFKDIFERLKNEGFNQPLEIFYYMPREKLSLAYVFPLYSRFTEDQFNLIIDQSSYSDRKNNSSHELQVVRLDIPTPGELLIANFHRSPYQIPRQMLPVPLR